MKQLIKVVSVFIFSIFLFSVVAHADYASSFAKQKEMDELVLELLQENALDQLEQYIHSIPDCATSQEGQAVDICTFDNTDGQNFVTHVLQRGFSLEHQDYNVVSPDVSLYEGLQRIYLSLYHKNPRTLDIGNYKDFYKRYKGSWLNDRVEQILIRIWQKGGFLGKYSNFSCLTGETIYNTLYLSYMLELDNMYKYVSSEISFDLGGFTGGRGRLRTILIEMKRASDETDSDWLLKSVAASWFESLISPESWDKTEQEFYQGKKQKRMYDMFNEEGWDMFANAGLTPTKWQQHAITLYARACNKVIKDEKKCSAFQNGAAKYGFYTLPVQIEDKVTQQLNDELDNKTVIQKEVKNKEVKNRSTKRKSRRLDKGYLPL